MTIASGGTLGTGVASTSASSFTLTTATNALAAGDFALLKVVTDNTQTTTGPSTDHTGVSGANLGATKLGEYTNGQSAAEAGVTTSLWLLEATGAVPIGTVITISLATARVDKVASAWKFTKAAGMAIRLCNVPGQFAANPIMDAINAANGFGSAAFSGGPSQSRLYFRAMGKEANSTTGLTVSSGFTQTTAQRSRNNALAVLVRGEFRINTSTGETSNPTMAVSGDTAAVFAALEEYDAKPVITVQPTNQSALDGGNATFSFTATGASSYKWQEQVSGGGGGGAAYIPGSVQRLTTGDNTIDIPVGAQSALVFLPWWHGGGSTPTLTCTALPDLNGSNKVFTNGNPAPPYEAGRLRSRSSVTATGTQTLTIGGQTDIFNGPAGFIVFLDGPVTVVDEDMVSVGETGDASLTLDTVAGALVFVLDCDMDTATPPTNPEGWTSLDTYSTNSMVSRLRMLTAADAAGVTTGSDAFYETLIGYSVEGGSGPSWEDLAGETTDDLALTSLTLADNGRKFRGVAINSYGETLTNEVTLSVTDGKVLFVDETTGDIDIADDQATVAVIDMEAGDLDLLIIGAGVVSGAAPNISTPAGYTKLDEATDLPLATVVSTTLCVFWRFADGPAASVALNSTNDAAAPVDALWSWTRASYRNVNPTTPIGESILGHLAASTSHVLPGYEADKTKTTYLGWIRQAVAQGGTVTAPMIRRINDEASGIVVGEEQIEDLGPTGTRTIAVPASSDTIYAVLQINSLVSEGEGTTTVNADLSGNYEIHAVVGADLSGGYDVASIVGADLAGAYDINTLVDADLVGNYGIHSIVGADLLGTYGITAAVGADLGGNYDVNALVGAGLEGGYAIQGLAGASLAGAYSLDAVVGADLEGGYGIAGVAGASLDGAYAITETVGADLLGGFLLLNIVGADLQGTYEVRAAVGASLHGAYSIDAVVGASLAGAYDIEPADGVVGSNLQGGYAVHAIVGKDLDGSFAVLSVVGSGLQGGYEIREAVGANLSGSYGIAGSVSASLEGGYALLNAVGGNLQGAYDILSAVGAAVAGAYAVNVLAGASLEGGYAIEGSVGASLDGAYDVLVVVGASLPGSYEIQEPGEPVGASLQGAYLIRALVRANLSGSYLVESDAVTPSLNPFNFAAEIMDARRTLHDTLAIDATYEDDTMDEPKAVRVRWHTKTLMHGDLLETGFAQTIESQDKIVLVPSDTPTLTFRKNGEIKITAWGSGGPTFLLQERERRTGPLEEVWRVVPQ